MPYLRPALRAFADLAGAAHHGIVAVKPGPGPGGWSCMRRVRSGLDRWNDDGPQLAALRRGARIGLLVHAASVDSAARHAVDVVRADAACRLVRLFAPEHGLWGHEQDMEVVRHTHDPRSGLPVVSLYGDDPASLRPRAADLEGLDAVVADIQDVGSRYYTFVYTLAFLMEAAAQSCLPIIVLDRPNPVGGVRVEGPVLDPTLRSFVGRFPIPVRHGMTVGELARLIRGAFDVACDLRVVPMDGWRREMRFEDTGLPWVAPSPNMPSPATARVYPGGCLIEGTNLSEGRGTTQPFELVGAPWLDGHALADALRAAALPGLLVRAASFRPMFHKHAGRSCGGVQVIVDEPATFTPFATYLALIRGARELAPERFAWRTETYEFEDEHPAIDYLLGRPGLRQLLEGDLPLDEIAASWRADLDAFVRAREPYLLYD